MDLKYQKIGDIMVKFSHFFKMYTEYVKNFENARTIINVQYQKNSKFAAIMDEIHVSWNIPKKLHHINIWKIIFPYNFNGLNQKLVSIFKYHQKHNRM